MSYNSNTPTFSYSKWRHGGGMLMGFVILQVLVVVSVTTMQMGNGALCATNAHSTNNQHSKHVMQQHWLSMPLLTV